MKPENWTSAFASSNQPLVIAGPCSAESYAQLLNVATSLKEQGIGLMRAGVWKPRTRPNTFEGNGRQALDWIADVKKQTGVAIATEVASPQHIEQALQAGVDVLWLGARTTVNPFLVQELANVLIGVSTIVLVKNPINPDLSLWIGALERLHRAGVKKLGAIHRGFSSLQNSVFRNQPLWQLPLELKIRYPHLPLIADPSHIAGNRHMIFEVSQKALDLGYDGLMIETHPDPDNALSDAQQQITPGALKELLATLRIAERSSDDIVFLNQLEQLRERIDQMDQELINTLASRMRLVEKIGDYKKENNVTVFQLERWNEIMKTRPEWGQHAHLAADFIKELYRVIHDESLRIQTEIMNQSETRHEAP